MKERPPSLFIASAGGGIAVGILLGAAQGALALPPTDQPSLSSDSPSAFPPALEAGAAVSPEAVDLQRPPVWQLAEGSGEDANLEVAPEVLEESDLFRRWQTHPPDVFSDIQHDPSFRTRLRLGYSQFPSSGQAGGVYVGVEDVFIGRTGLTVSGDYNRSWAGERQAVGADLRYYVLPLGNYVNLAPVVGYRSLQTAEYSTDGVNVGFRVVLVPSRGGGADIAVNQVWVAPGTDREVGMTTLSVGFAVTNHLRLSTDIQTQNARQNRDSRVGVGLEWML